MKSRFWANVIASVIAIILVVVIVLLNWFLNGKPMAFSNEELIIFDTAALALYFSLRNDLLGKEE